MARIVLNRADLKNRKRRKEEPSEEEKKKAINQARGQQRLTIVNFVWTALDIFDLKRAWTQEAARKGRKGRNLFIERTYYAYDTDLRIGMYNAMHFTAGRLIGLRNPRMTDGGAGNYTLTWQVNAEGFVASLDDRLRIIVLRESNSDVFDEIEGLTACRGDGCATFRIPEVKGLSGPAHLYAFFMSADGKDFSVDEHLPVWLDEERNDGVASGF